MLRNMLATTQRMHKRQYAHCFSTSTNNKTLSHITSDGQPTMVDITHKSITTRTATAEAIVYLPESVIDASKQYSSNSNELFSKKGSVFHTAIIAGTMAVKRTSDMIPFCHPLQINNCKFNLELLKLQQRTDIHIQYDSGMYVVIQCTVTVDGKTGVEMEAITGCNIAAMTIYDMCKAASHDIEIVRVRLLSKSGGKSNYVNKL